MLIAARSSQDFACCCTRNRERALEIRLRFRRIRLRRLERDFACNATDLGLEPSFFGCYSWLRQCSGERHQIGEAPQRQCPQYTGIQFLDPVDRNAVRPELITGTASEALTRCRAN